MERIVLSALPVKLDSEALMEQNHIPAGSDLAEEFTDLVNAAQAVLCCKAILMEPSEDIVLPTGKKPLFLYAMTVGTEIEADEDCDYPVLGDIVRQAALDCAMAYTKSYIKDKTGLDVTYLNPGSTQGWEQIENVSLFSRLNAGEIGITCDTRGYMKPWYSTLGAFTEV